MAIRRVHALLALLIAAHAALLAAVFFNPSDSVVPFIAFPPIGWTAKPTLISFPVECCWITCIVIFEAGLLVAWAFVGSTPLWLRLPIAVVLVAVLREYGAAFMRRDGFVDPLNADWYVSGIMRWLDRELIAMVLVFAICGLGSHRATREGILTRPFQPCQFTLRQLLIAVAQFAALITIYRTVLSHIPHCGLEPMVVAALYLLLSDKGRLWWQLPMTLLPAMLFVVLDGPQAHRGSQLEMELRWLAVARTVMGWCVVVGSVLMVRAAGYRLVRRQLPWR